jgi:SAM-dependent methyltransferase
MEVSVAEKSAMDDHLNLIHQARVHMVESLLPSGDMILDLGGANAPLYEMGYPHRFEKLVLIDLPPEDRHDYYKEIVINPSSDGGEVVVKYNDMTQLEDFQNETVDFVWSGQSIEHVPIEAGKRMCESAFRVLKKGGYFCLDTPNRFLTEIHTQDIGGGFIHPEHCLEYYPDQLQKLIEGAGFVIEKSLGICHMPKTAGSNKFYYEDFVRGDQITENVNESYIQFFKCRKS